jgi:hypothetical protein
MNSLLAIFAFLLLSSSCIEADYFPCVKPSGETLTETRITDTFDAVTLSLHGNVYITYGTENSIEIVAPENLFEHISTSTRNNNLSISSNRCLRNKLEDIQIYITTPEISSLKMMGSGNIIVESPFYGSLASLEISGSGNILFHDANYQNLRSSISGSGKIKVAGQTENHQLQVSGSGKVNAYELISEQAQVRISGSGSVEITVVKHIEARISGSGKVFYKGNPGTNFNISGSGSVQNVAGSLPE